MSENSNDSEYLSFRSRHREYLKNKYNKDNSFKLDSVVPALILFMSSFVIFLETGMNTFLSVVEGRPICKKACNLFFQWYLMFEEIGVGLFGSLTNCISDSNKELLSEKIQDTSGKFSKIYSRFERFFYNENKELMENILNDFKAADSDDEEPGNCEKKD